MRGWKTLHDDANLPPCLSRTFFRRSTTSALVHDEHLPTRRPSLGHTLWPSQWQMLTQVHRKLHEDETSSQIPHARACRDNATAGLVKDRANQPAESLRGPDNLPLLFLCTTDCDDPHQMISSVTEIRSTSLHNGHSEITFGTAKDSQFKHETCRTPQPPSEPFHLPASREKKRAGQRVNNSTSHLRSPEIWLSNAS
jgi:hypothetical protein